MAVTITPKAAGEFLRTVTDRNLGMETFLRIGVVGGGCSGFQYSLNFDTASDPAKDHISEHHGMKLVVDKKSLMFLDGATLDYYDGLDKRGFTFENPNAVKSCGCGSSFSA